MDFKKIKCSINRLKQLCDFALFNTGVILL